MYVCIVRIFRAHTSSALAHSLAFQAKWRNEKWAIQFFFLFIRFTQKSHCRSYAVRVWWQVFGVYANANACARVYVCGRKWEYGVIFLSLSLSSISSSFASLQNYIWFFTEKTKKITGNNDDDDKLRMVLSKSANTCLGSVCSMRVYLTVCVSKRRKKNVFVSHTKFTDVTKFPTHSVFNNSDIEFMSLFIMLEKRWGWNRRLNHC